MRNLLIGGVLIGALAVVVFGFGVMDDLFLSRRSVEKSALLDKDEEMRDAKNDAKSQFDKDIKACAKEFPDKVGYGYTVCRKTAIDLYDARIQDAKNPGNWDSKFQSRMDGDSRIWKIPADCDENVTFKVWPLGQTKKVAAGVISEDGDIGELAFFAPDGTEIKADGDGLYEFVQDTTYQHLAGQGDGSKKKWVLRITPE